MSQSIRGRKSKKYMNAEYLPLSERDKLHEEAPSEQVTLASERTYLSPEVNHIVETYMTEGELSIDATANLLDLPREKISRVLSNTHVRSYINELFWESGYRNRGKIFGLMDRIIEEKIEEAEESEQWSKKDLVEIIEKYFKMMMEMRKLEKDQPTPVHATQNNLISTNESNFERLASQLMRTK